MAGQASPSGFFDKCSGRKIFQATQSWVLGKYQGATLISSAAGAAAMGDRNSHQPRWASRLETGAECHARAAAGLVRQEL